MPVRDHEEPDRRQGSESSGNSSYVSQETIRNNESPRQSQTESSSNGRDPDAFPGTLTMDK